MTVALGGVWGNIVCDDAETAQLVFVLAEKNPLLREDLDHMQKADFSTPWTIVRGSGSLYRHASREVQIGLGRAESICHEVHHAGQHAALKLLGSVEPAEILGQGKFALANEVSALATGYMAPGGYTEITSLAKAVKEGFLRYDNNPLYINARCQDGLDSLRSKKWFEYSRQRLLNLGLSAEWLAELTL